MRRPATLLLAVPALVAQAPPSPAGDWTATLEAGGMRLRVVLHLAPTPEGGWTGTLDSPDQGAKGMKLADITWKEGALGFALPMAGARFDGSLDPVTQKLAGTWTQGGQLPLTFVRGVPAAPRRPQEPHPPYPYAVKEVTLPGGAAHVRLGGTLTLPAGKGPFPGVVLIHGSGPNDRDEAIFGHKPFHVLADHLSRQGIAVLRYDKRGVKASSGSYAQATTEDFAADAEAALSFLAQQPDIDGRRVGLLGHSEGGDIAPMVAARSPKPAFLVLLAGSAVPGEDLLYAQGEALAKGMGAPAEAIREQRKGQEQLFSLLKQHPEASPETLRDLLAAELPPEDRKAAEAGLLQQARQVANPWFRAFLTLDPRVALRKVKVPVLALFGEKDLQVPPAQNRPELEKALKTGGNRRADVRTLAGLNHLFQPAKTGTIAEYEAIETTLDPAVLTLLSDWIRKRH